MDLLGKNNESLWESFIRNEENYLPQYLNGWKEAIKTSYPKCDPLYYLKLEEDKVSSGFPFFFVKSKIFGDRIISLPFLDNGGFIGNYNKNDLKNLIYELNKKNPKFIEVRLCSFMENFDKDKKILKGVGFSENSSKQQVIIKIDKKEDLWNSFRREVRKGVNKGIKENLEIKEISNENELRNFYKLYLNNMKKFGSPPHSRDLFKNLFHYMKGDIKGINCYKNKEIIGAMIIFFSKNYAYLAFNVFDSKHSKLRPNDFLYWDLIKWCSSRGIKYLDLGQVEKEPEKESRAEGIKIFKLKWNGKLYERIDFSYSAERNLENHNKNKGKLKNLRNLWKKLPSLLINKIGPKIVSQIAS